MTNPGYGKWRQPHASPVQSRGEKGPNLAPLAGTPSAAPKETGEKRPDPSAARAYDGEYSLTAPDNASRGSGPCSFSFDDTSCALVPKSGTPLAFDLGDIDAYATGDYELSLRLYSGETIALRRFGKSFTDLNANLLESYRARLVRCLLLEDLEEAVRFDATARMEPAGDAPIGAVELRLYKSNIAVLPAAATPFQWRFADIDSTDFDKNDYSTTLVNGDQRLVITKLAKRTEEFGDRLRTLIAAVSAQGAQAVRGMFPFLNPAQFQQVAGIFKEGRTVPIADLSRIHPAIGASLLEKIVDAKMKPYFDHLNSIAAAGLVGTGFKIIREENPAEEENTGEPEAQQEEGDGTGDQTGEPGRTMLHWFFFPIPSANLIAWEAVSATGRATYFFRISGPDRKAGLADVKSADPLIRSAIRDINRALVILNFRREPIYLPDESIETQERFHRYAIACRKIPELRRLRKSFVARSIHSTFEAWKTQVAGILSGSAAGNGIPR